MKIPAKAYAVLAGSILIITAVLIFRFGFAVFTPDISTRLSVIVLVGLGLTVVFMALLAIIYSVMGVEDKGQALALPEGSVRALLAFSLVLIFVCLGAFLFSEVNKPCDNCVVTMPIVHDSELADLRNNFVIAAEQATGPGGKLLYEQIPDPNDKTKTVDDLKHPLFKITRYPKKNTDAADFAKQIFTTLATVFVSVVSFYFGSSVTTSATRAGVIAAQGGDGAKKTADLQSALTNALADSHNAQLAAAAAADALTKAQDDSKADPSNQQKLAAIGAAQKALDAANSDLKAKQAKVQAAQDAMKAPNTPNTGSAAQSNPAT